jgi:hypothetical protein
MTNDEKIKMADKIIQQRQKYTQRHLARTSLMIEKAIKAGIVVTDAEVDAEIKKRSAKK